MHSARRGLWPQCFCPLCYRPQGICLCGFYPRSFCPYAIEFDVTPTSLKFEGDSTIITGTHAERKLEHSTLVPQGIYAIVSSLLFALTDSYYMPTLVCITVRRHCDETMRTVVSLAGPCNIGRPVFSHT